MSLPASTQRRNLIASPPGVKTAWTDPEHVRLTQPTPEERVHPKRAQRLHGPDPDDPWATPLPAEALDGAA